jgi:hypothetical protein
LAAAQLTGALGHLTDDLESHRIGERLENGLDVDLREVRGLRRRCWGRGWREHCLTNIEQMRTMLIEQ